MWKDFLSGLRRTRTAWTRTAWTRTAWTQVRTRVQVQVQAVRVPGPAAPRGFNRKLCSSAGTWKTGTGTWKTSTGTGTWKTSTGTGTWKTETGKTSTGTGTWKTSTVDPVREEPFVFVDLTDPEENPDRPHLLLPPLTSSSSAPPRPPRSLELQVMRGVSQQEAEPEVQDVDFPLDVSLVASSRKKKKKKTGRGQAEVFGTEDAAQPISDTACSGCGAVLQCRDRGVPGFLPSEKFKVLVQERRLGDSTCQRCHMLTHHQRALNLYMSPDQYRAVVQRLRPLRALVVLVVDLLDVPDSIVPELPALVGTDKPVVVVGNKVDLLPADGPDFLPRLRRRLLGFCRDAGFGQQVRDVRLISAKTGYGVETLVSSLQRTWRYRGDVFLVGSANAGKSTLFNALLDSDYCKTRASDLVPKATMSPWPGTTLNLLKFPIINPTPYRMLRRQDRLKETETQTEDQMCPQETKRLRHFSRQGYLVGRVGRTFRSPMRSQSNEIDFDPDSLAFGESDEGETARTAPSRSEVPFNDVKDARWLFDTPGILKDQDLLSLLTEQEVMSVVPTRALVPRTFVLKPNMSLFVGGVARIDFLQGGTSCWFSVMASSRVPVHVTSLEKADGFYERHAGHVLLGVPAGGAERMKRFPALVPHEFSLEGRGHGDAAADVQLSSAGWVAVTAACGVSVSLRVHCPPVSGFRLRTPPLLPHIVSLKGTRIGTSPSYRTTKNPTEQTPQKKTKT